MKIYLAIPYSGYEDLSFLHANKVAGKLMRQGYLVFSPISHTHPIASQCNLPKGWDYWETFDKTFIQWSDALYISSFGNWKTSKGVQAEIEIAKSLNKRIHFMSKEEES